MDAHTDTSSNPLTSQVTASPIQGMDAHLNSPLSTQVTASQDVFSVVIIIHTRDDIKNEPVLPGEVSLLYN